MPRPKKRRPPKSLDEIPLLATSSAEETPSSPQPSYVGGEEPSTDATARETIIEASGVTGPESEPALRKEPSAAAVIAENFMSLVASGKDREEAGRAVTGQSYQEFKSRTEVVRAVENLMDRFHLEPEVRRKTRKAAVNRVLLQNVESPDPLGQKLVLEAAKQIAADEGVTQSKTVVGVQVNLDDLLPFLSPPTQEHE